MITQGTGVEVREVGFWAPAGQERVEIREHRLRQSQFAPDGRVFKRCAGESFQFDRALIVRGQFPLGDGPAAPFHPGALLEVDGIELQDLATPSRGGAADGAKAAIVDAMVAKAGDLAAIGVLRGLLDVFAAAFQHHHAPAMAGQFHGKQDAGRAGADDAYVGTIARGGGGLDQVANHVLAAPGKRHRSPPGIYGELPCRTMAWRARYERRRTCGAGRMRGQGRQAAADSSQQSGQQMGIAGGLRRQLDGQ